MIDDSTGTLQEPLHEGGRQRTAESGPALVVAFGTERGRVGETFIVEKDDHVLGRGAARDDDPAPRLLPVRQRPDKNEACPPWTSPFLSRVQLRVSRRGSSLRIENVGRCPLRDGDGREVRELELAPGECMSLGDQLLMVCALRPARLPAARSVSASVLATPFGEADATGFVGESPCAWRLRETIAFVGGRAAHVLILGPSGSGKEVAAQALHRASDRKGKRLVARNAATIPATLVEAELFGNAVNYPNAGMPERPGLVGEADGSTLFLDEIGELPEELQTKLLRLLDGAGDYQRLGDARRRNADVRFVGATNRDIDTLRHDFAARFKLRLALPGLLERREDIPLLAAHLMCIIAKGDAEIAQRFMEGWDGTRGEPRMTLALARALLRHDYATNVRELESLLWLSISSSPAEILELTPELEAELGPRGASPVAPEEVGADEVRAALERAGGVRERAWRDLGLANRYVLKRLIKRFGIDSPGGND